MPPRPSPGEYQAHAQAGAVTIAAEFEGRSVPTLNGPLASEEYVAIETGFFGPPGARTTISDSDFSLRINGKKPLPCQPFGLVAESVKDPEWAPPVPVESKAKTVLNSGGSSDQGQGDSKTPPPPVKIPIEIQRGWAQRVQRVALPEGERTLPQAGLIFFQYRGKVERIDSIELIYAGPAGKATLELQP
ncbi:MAG: hypothetical protein ACLQVN_14685 [Bryobacteraceae bacterium]